MLVGLLLFTKIAPLFTIHLLSIGNNEKNKHTIVFCYIAGTLPIHVVYVFVAFPMKLKGDLSWCKPDVDVAARVIWESLSRYTDRMPAVDLRQTTNMLYD
jgi:hypothetical protein